MTTGHGSFGVLNVALLFTAVVGAGLFARAEAKAASPLIPLTIFRDPVLSAGFAMSTLVTTVVMATLVVGPFYLSGALALDAARVGLVMSSGPIVAALTGVPAGRIVDRFGAHRITIAGLIAMAAGCAILPMLPTRFGVPGYIAPLVVITAGYALFQAANNTAVMTNIRPDQRGVISGMLNLSRNLGLITGASVMGTVFALGSAATNIMTARPEAVAAGMRITFAVAAVLIFVALAIALASHARSRRAVPSNHEQRDGCGLELVLRRRRKTLLARAFSPLAPRVEWLSDAARRRQMQGSIMKFFKVGEIGKTKRWVDLDKVEAVDCRIESSGGGPNIESVTDSAFPKSNPVKQTPVIMLSFSSGAKEEIRFTDIAEAERFLEGHFGIAASFSQI